MKPMTAPDTTAVERALADVANIQADLDQVQTVLAARIDELNDQIVLLGMDLHKASLPVDRELLHRLYWSAESLPTQSIRNAFNLRSANDISTLAGPAEVRLPCKDCGVVLTCQAMNRPLTKLRGSSRCEACVAVVTERERQRHAESEMERRRQHREDEDAVRRAMETYVLANPELPKEQAGMETWVGRGLTAAIGNYPGAAIRVGPLAAMEVALSRPQTPTLPPRRLTSGRRVHSPDNGAWWG